MIVRREYEPGNFPPLTEEQKKMLEELEKMPDSEIDYSDIPEITDEEWKRFKRVKDMPERRKHA